MSRLAALIPRKGCIGRWVTESSPRRIRFGTNIQEKLPFEKKKPKPARINRTAHFSGRRAALPERQLDLAVETRHSEKSPPLRVHMCLEAENQWKNRRLRHIESTE